MDKNTIIGFLLIGAIIIAFTFLNRPSPEQLAEQQRLRDSIQLVEQQRAALEAEQLAVDSERQISEIKQQTAVTDFFAAGTTAVTDSIDMPGDSVATVSIASEELVTLENDRINITLSTLGGRVLYV